MLKNILNLLHQSTIRTYKYLFEDETLAHVGPQIAYNLAPSDPDI